MNTKLNHWLQFLKKEMRLFFGVSLGIFLFVLFFQPFPLDNFEFNDRILFVSGIGAIIFVLMVFERSLFPQPRQHSATNPHPQNLPTFIGDFLLLALSAVALAFYLRYVGGVSISFFVMSKIVFICFVPPVVIELCDTFRELKQENLLLLNEKTTTQKQSETCQEDYLNKPIIFTSDNSTENLKVTPVDVVFIKSADNYVEFVFKDQNDFNKVLLRNTLKKIEQQLQAYPQFIRSHRTCIINTKYLDKITKTNHNHWLSVKDYDEQIPVSRQYLLRVKESLA